MSQIYKFIDKHTPKCDISVLGVFWNNEPVLCTCGRDMAQVELEGLLSQAMNSVAWKQQAEDSMRDNDLLRKQVRKLKEILRKYEWSGWEDIPYRKDICPYCYEHRDNGHATDCELDKAFKEQN